MPLKKKIDLLKEHGDVFQKINVMVSVLKKKPDGQLIKQKVNFKEIMANLDQVATVFDIGNRILYKTRANRVNIKSENINILIKQKEIPFSIIIIDSDFVSALLDEKFWEIVAILGKYNGYYFVSYAIHENTLLEPVDKETEQLLIGNLLNRRSYYLDSWNDSTRRYMPGIKKYEQICVSNVPEGINGEWLPCGAYIISPITLNQWKAYKRLKYGEFVGEICSSIEYCNLIDYVCTHQFIKEKYSKKEIEETYERFIKELYYLFKR